MSIKKSLIALSSASLVVLALALFSLKLSTDYKNLEGEVQSRRYLSFVIADEFK